LFPAPAVVNIERMRFLAPVVLLIANIHAADANLTVQERAQLIQLLKDSQQEFNASIANVTDAQWKWKPAPERWSVGETSEHIMLAEGLLWDKMQEALHNPPSPDWDTKTAGKTELLLKVMAPRVGKAQAPEDIVPSGKLTKDETMARFAVARARTLKFAEESKISLKEYVAPHPFAVFNPLNAYQWILYIPLHNQRHIKQIEEVKATVGFPGTELY
jgi:hypothetical protein